MIYDYTLKMGKGGELNLKDYKGKVILFTYSAKDQAELKKIREKYTDHEESKLERLRRLDSSVTKKGTVVSLILGILGTLILGIGMSLIMTDFSAILGQYENLAFPIGISIGLFGAALVAIAYPVYVSITKRQRKKLAPEILRLTDELLK